MPEYKLTYFDIEGIVEPVRFLFSYGGIEFEDVRLSNDEWIKVKPTTPFGKVPTLEHNGNKVDQSLAIARYVAKQVKLTGRDDWDDLKIDAIVDTLNEVRMRVSQWYYSSDEQVKKSLGKTLYEVILPYSFDRMEAFAQANDGYLAVGYLTWADVYFASLVKYFNHLTKIDVLENHPALAQLKDRVFAIPNIKKWVENRPKSVF